MTTAVKKRIEWIDIAKGIGITLVSFGHLRNGDGQSVWLPALDSLIAAIYLFHMPLFFLLGGMTFSMRGRIPSIPRAEDQDAPRPLLHFLTLLSC